MLLPRSHPYLSVAEGLLATEAGSVRFLPGTSRRSECRGAATSYPVALGFRGFRSGRSGHRPIGPAKTMARGAGAELCGGSEPARIAGAGLSASQ